ncbi:MAG: hypothetical protein ACPGRW_06275 [Flavobacteriaceae bacterium]
MAQNFLKSWKTTLIGFLILSIFIYDTISNNKALDVSIMNGIVSLLVTIGFITSKDATATHTTDLRSSRASEIIEGPDPKKEEK